MRFYPIERELEFNEDAREPITAADAEEGDAAGREEEPLNRFA